jgi:hypothetical protein
VLDKLQNSDFIPYLSQTFRVHVEGMEPIELELVHVTEAGKGPHLRRDNDFYNCGRIILSRRLR